MPKRPPRKSQTKTKQIKTKEKKKNRKNIVEKDFDKFRHDIYKLGLSGLDKGKQLDARVELAIKLGAKPKSWIKKHQPLGADNNNGQARKANKHFEANSSLST